MDTHANTESAPDSTIEVGVYYETDDTFIQMRGSDVNEPFDDRTLLRLLFLLTSASMALDQIGCVEMKRVTFAFTRKDIDSQVLTKPTGESAGRYLR